MASTLNLSVKLINVIILMLLVAFYVVACVNNSDVHTHFHGTGTGTLLSARYDRYWFAQFFFCIVSMLLLITNVVPATKQLNAWTFPPWFVISMFCLIVMGLWWAGMVLEFLNANSCSRPLNRGNDLMWCAACSNATVPGTGGLTGSDFCRWRPLPEDVMTTGQLGISSDFFWVASFGTALVALFFVVFIVSLVQYHKSNPDDVPPYVRRAFAIFASSSRRSPGKDD